MERELSNHGLDIRLPSILLYWGVVDKHLYLLEVHRARMEYPELKRTIVRLAELHNAQHVLIEDKASGTQLLQDLKNDGFDRATAFKSEADKTTRMYAVTNTITSGFLQTALSKVPGCQTWGHWYAPFSGRAPPKRS